MTETQLRQKYIEGLLAIEGKCADGSTAVSGSDTIVSGATYTLFYIAG